MEGFYAEKPNSGATLTTTTNTEQMIDLTLKLSPCGQNAEEKCLTRSSSICGMKAKSTVANGAHKGPIFPWLDRSCSLPAEAEKGPMSFGDLQTMRRVRTGKRLLLEKQRRAAAAAAAARADKPRAVSTPPPAGGQPPPARAIDKLKTLVTPPGGSWHEGGASCNIKTSPMQENDSMISPKAVLQGMPLRPADTKLESPAKKLKTMNPCLKGDEAMDILRRIPSVTTTGDGPTGKRIEGLLYKYRGGEVCIVCVCHGSFLSPAEFVMHAGGKEVANPMKHITVCTNSF